MKRIIQQKTFHIVLYAALSLGSLFLMKNTSLIKRVENTLFDSRAKYSNNRISLHEDIVLILVDDASIKTMEDLVGRWPWPRSLWGDFVDYATESGAKAILFDILFSEAEVARDEDGNLGESDLRLAESTAASGIVFHAFQASRDRVDELNQNLLNRDLPEAIILKNKESINDYSSFMEFFELNQYIAPLSELMEYSWGLGDVAFQSDLDGIYRRVYPYRKYQGHYLPTLPIAFLLKYLMPKQIDLDDRSLKIDEINIPLDESGQYLIDMKKEYKSFSASGVFATIQKIQNGEIEDLIIPPSELENKIILVGVSAVGLEDIKATSVGLKSPGSYLHASFISNVLNNSFISYVSPITILILLIIVMLGLNFLMLNLSSVFLKNGIYWGFFSLYIFSAYASFDQTRVLLPMAWPLLSLLLNYLFIISYKIFIEGKDKRFLKKAFGNYISPELIEIMHESGEAPKLGGEAGVKTAFFTDIQSFSTFSEQLDASTLVELLNEYLTDMTDILLANKGTLDKYEGDAIIAFYGAPMKLEDHAELACKTALQMQEKLLKLRSHWIAQGDKWPLIVHNMRMRIGINSGDMVTGNMGSKNRMNYTMIGDAVNLAARLEESAKQYGIFNHVSEMTRELCHDKFIFRELDTIKVVGKSQPVTSYDLMGEVGKTESILIQLKEKFEEGLDHYKNQRWKEAMIAFESSLILEKKRYDDTKTNPSEVYLNRVKNFMLYPPPQNWDGVYTLSHK